MSRTQEKLAALRLCLPGPSRWTVGQAREVRTCIGCRAVWQDQIRFVHAIRGCPAHSATALTKDQRGQS